MNSKVGNVLFVRRRIVEPTTMLGTINGGELRPTKTKMAESISPMLTSLKIFGLYFKRPDAGDKSAGKQSHRRWNVFMIYSSIVVITMWIHVIRMFSVFNNFTRTELNTSFHILLVCIQRRSR